MTGDTLTDVRVLTREQVASLNEKAAENGWARVAQSLMTKLMDGYHLATLSERGEGRRRASLTLRITGRHGRQNAYLEIADEDWEALPLRDELMERTR